MYMCIRLPLPVCHDANHGIVILLPIRPLMENLPSSSFDALR